MPYMNGFELYERLREKDKEFKICFITAFEIYFQSLAEFYPRLDVKCFLRKPISFEELTKHVFKELNDNHR